MKSLVDYARAAELHPVGKRLAVGLIDSAEATPLALGVVVVPMVIRVLRDQEALGDLLADLDPREAVDRERQAGQPRRAGACVVEVELGRAAIAERRALAEAVIDLDQQMRLLAAEEVDVA